MCTPGKVITEESTDSGTEYTIIHTINIKPTGDQCPRCGNMLWSHSDSPNQLFTFGFMFQGAPVLSPHWYPCASGWD